MNVIHKLHRSLNVYSNLYWQLVKIQNTNDKR